MAEIPPPKRGGKPPVKRKAQQVDARRARQAEALRANLRRRKAGQAEPDGGREPQ